MVIKMKIKMECYSVLTEPEHINTDFQLRITAKKKKACTNKCLAADFYLLD